MILVKFAYNLNSRNQAHTCIHTHACTHLYTPTHPGGLFSKSIPGKILSRRIVFQIFPSVLWQDIYIYIYIWVSIVKYSRLNY